MSMFKKEAHYMWAAILLIVLHTLVLRFLVPHSVSSSPAAVSFANAMSVIVPAIGRLANTRGIDTQYWQFFFATFWVIAPFVIALGAAGTFFLTPAQYERRKIREVGLGRLFFGFLLALVLVLALWMMPFVSFGVLMDQTSMFLPKLLVSWLMVGGGLYGLPQGAILWITELTHRTAGK